MKKNGPKQSAKDAVYDIALSTEDNVGENKAVNVIVLDDLEKGFEKVVHSDLVAKAKVYAFPRCITLALSMYTAAKRIRCGSAYSKLVFTKVGVLAGCPIAMVLLLLANLDPVEKFWQALPLHMRESIAVFKVYVDDFVLLLSFDGSKLTDDQIVMRTKGIYIRLADEIRKGGATLPLAKAELLRLIIKLP